MRKEIGKYSIIFVGLIAGLLLMPIWASAVILDTTSFDLNGSNLGAGYLGPFVHIVVDRTSTTTADITATSLTNGGFTYLLTDGSSLALSVNGTSFTASGISGTPSTSGGFTPNYGSQQVNGFGRFNFTIDDFDSFTHAADSLTLTLTDLSANWAAASDVLVPNNNDNLAAAHIGALAPSGTGFAITGYSAGNGGSIPPIEVPVPEPGTIILLGSGIIGLGLYGGLRLRK